jgi:hypothetical protein
VIVPCRSEGCGEVTARFAVEAARLEHLLPDGFRFAPSGVAGADDAAELTVRVLRADETISVSGRMTFGGGHACVLAAVEPPPALALAGADSHAIELYGFRDGAVSFRSRDDNGGGRRFRGCAVHLPVMLTIDGHLPGGGELPAPATTMRIFVTDSGEVRETADVAATSASESRPGPARLRIDGLTTLPPVLDGTAVFASGFDATVALAQASAVGRSALPHPNLS